MTDISAAIGKRIRTFRNAQGISLEELSFKADLNAAHLGQIERGLRNPTIETLNRIATALDISFYELIGSVEEVPQKQPETNEIKRKIDAQLSSMTLDEQKDILRIIRIFRRRFDEEKGLMENITIEEFEKSHLARIQTAKQAYWENGSWRLEDGNVYTMNEAEGIKSTAKFKEQIIPLDVTPREISWEQKEPEEMTIRELREYISVLERQHQPTARQWCEIYMRISIPLASFFFAMIGAPLGTQKQRTRSSIVLGISIIVIFIYYAIMTLTTGLGKGGVMNPLLACIIPNLICLGAGVFLLQKKNA